MSNKYSKAELNKFKKSIEHKISLIANEVDTIKEGLGSSSNKQGGLTPDSIYSVHMADAGTDSHERMIEVPNATKCVNCKEKGKLGLI